MNPLLFFAEGMLAGSAVTVMLLLHFAYRKATETPTKPRGFISIESVEYENTFEFTTAQPVAPEQIGIAIGREVTRLALHHKIDKAAIDPGTYDVRLRAVATFKRKS